MQIEKFSLDTSNNELLNIDGELKGNTPIQVEVIPNAIKVLEFSELNSNNLL